MTDRDKVPRPGPAFKETNEEPEAVDLTSIGSCRLTAFEDSPHNLARWKPFLRAGMGYKLYDGARLVEHHHVSDVEVSSEVFCWI